MRLVVITKLLLLKEWDGPRVIMAMDREIRIVMGVVAAALLHVLPDNHASHRETDLNVMPVI